MRPNAARFFHKEYHFNAEVHVGTVLLDFATGGPNGHVARDSNLNPLEFAMHRVLAGHCRYEVRIDSDSDPNFVRPRA